MATLIKHKQTALQKFDGNAMQIKDWIIEQPFYSRLNRLKKSNPEAFFYWYRVYELERGS